MDDPRPDPSPATAVVTAARVRLTDAAVRVGPPDKHPEHGEPRIQVIRENGEIRAIDITCGCGEKIRIRCDYA